MNDEVPRGSGGSGKRRWLIWSGVAVLAASLVLLFIVQALLERIDPVLKERVVESLSARFDSRVELKSLHLSLRHGAEVKGVGLNLYPNHLPPGTPLLEVDSFSFRTRYMDLFRKPLRIGRVDLNGMRIHLPPKTQRQEIPKLNASKSSPGNPKILVDEIHAVHTVLVLATDKPDKKPLEFDINDLVLSSVGDGQPMKFTAMLVNPKPVGNIRSSGSFGPWKTEDPRQTPVSGIYSFSEANLGTLKGIQGILSSSGRYQGTLENISVDGSTDTPDFQVNISGHKVPLHTDFHAIVDGTNGNTYLQPVKARFLNSALTASGYVVRNPNGPGHDIHLEVVIDKAHIEDLLQLGVRTSPPFMNGYAKVRTELTIPPENKNIADKLRLLGRFEITDAHFSNPKVQSAVDEFSLRGQGQRGMAEKEAKNPSTANTSSQMRGNFRLANGLLTITNLRYNVPGADINLNGIYSLDGNKFDFFGTAGLTATLSQLVGGWKGFLLRPANRFFRKNGHGLEVPIKISGTKSEPHFGLDLHHDDPEEEKLMQQKQQPPSAPAAAPAAQPPAH